MVEFAKVFYLGLSILILRPLGAGAAEKTDPEEFDWTPVIEAIIQVESEGNPRAVSGSSVGAMQITPILVKECNNILKERKSDKRYTMEDRYSVEKSKEMFLLIQSQHNKTNNVERAIRLWNGGLKYSIQGTNQYLKKVMRHIK